MTTLSRTVSQTLLIVLLAFASVVLIDITLLDGGLLADNLLESAKSNNTAISVILSGLLLLAYLMQFLVQDTQTDLMKRQENIMSAGYTPIIGIKSKEWGKQRSEDTDIDPYEANKYYLKLVNDGNSTARDLRLWIGVAYDHECHDTYYTSTTVPLQRTDEGTWWPTNVGGALSESTETSTEFVAEPALDKMRKTLWGRSEEWIKNEDISSVLESLYDCGVEEVSLVFSIRYSTATGEDQEIDIGVRREKLRTLEDVGWTLYDTQEGSSSEIETVKQSAQ